MPTVPKVAGREVATDAQVLERGPSPKVKHSTPEDRPNPRLSVYDDLLRATQHLPAAERMAIVMPAIMSDPAAYGAGQDLQQAIERHVPAAEELNAEG
jgi:hypothetical protein